MVRRRVSVGRSSVSVPRGRRERGLTIVELMVTMLIASIVAASTFMFFAGQRRIYDTQSKIINMQQTVWASMETVSRFVRAAGMGMVGCVRPGSPLVAGDTGDLPPGTAMNAMAPLTGLRAFWPTALAGYTLAGGTIRLAPLWVENGNNAANNGTGEPDRLTVVFGTNGSGNLDDSALGTTVMTAPDPIRLADAFDAPLFRQGEFFLLLDRSVNPPGPPAEDRGCTLFQLTGDAFGNPAELPHAGTSTWNPGNNPPGFIPFIYQGQAANSPTGIRNFGQLNWVRFSIRPPNEGPPALMMQRMHLNEAPQVLADGIEDMQISYACDMPPMPAVIGPGDGLLNEEAAFANRAAATDEWVFNHPDDNPLGPDLIRCNRPQAVRITLVSRALAADDTVDQAQTDNRRPALEDRPQGPQDQFRRRLITTTIYPRNQAVRLDPITP